MREAIAFHLSDDEDEENDREGEGADDHQASDRQPEAVSDDVDGGNDDDLDVPPKLAAEILRTAGIE